jgi:AraC-like DNA-binding protein
MPPEHDLPAISDAGAHATAQVSYRAPAVELRGVITSYYLVRVTGRGTVEDQLFPEWPNFRVTLSGAWWAKFPGADWMPVAQANVTGALERALPVRGSEGVVVGVGLMPQGWPRLVGVEAHGFANCTRPLADAIGPVADALQARLTAAAADGEGALYAVLDETFAALLRPAADADLVRTAHATLQDPGVRTVSDWAEALGLSPRQLERISLRVFGVSPKRLLRRQRVLRTLAAMVEAPQGTWTQFLDDQYVDQAHFIREFRHYMGVTPQAFLARPSSFMAEAWRRRKAALGYPVQVLQPAREGS